MRMTLKGASLAATLLMSVTSASAQTVVSGTTTGCFGAACTNFMSSATYAIGASGEAINFAGTSFTGTTNAVTNGFTVGSFGSLVLAPPPTSSTPDTMFSTPFSLLFTLSAPTGANSPETTFIVSGFVGAGSRDISYSGGVTPFTFTGGTGTISVTGGSIGITSTDISGRVTAVAGSVPEPATWAMLLVGFGMMGATMRHRRRSTRVVYA